MAPHAIRRFLMAGLSAATLALPLAAAEKSAPQTPAAQPEQPSISQTPPANATHEQFVTWLRTTDLGKMIRRDKSAYTIERTKNGTIMRLDGPAFREVLVMVAPKANEEALPFCIDTPAQAEDLMKKAVEAKVEKP